LPNTSPAPRYCLYGAYNANGDARLIRVWQEGYVGEKKLTLTPSSIVLPRIVDSASTVSVVVDSSANWFCTTGDWEVIDTVFGNSGQTTINVSATTNTTGSERRREILFNNADGLTAILTIKQKGNAKVTLEQNANGWPITEVPASGRSISYRLVNDIECTVEPMGNTENYAVASGLVRYHTTVQPSSGTNLWIHFEENNTTVSRNAAFYAYYVDSQSGRHSVFGIDLRSPLVYSCFEL
jgi:hypothetical protein